MRPCEWVLVEEKALERGERYERDSDRACQLLSALDRFETLSEIAMNPFPL